jgi:acetylornithine deacetylase/succinyl-diaminopimelate desuccinylase-like protein
MAIDKDRQVQASMQVEARAIITNHLDRAYLLQTLVNLGRVPTAVSMGYQTLIEPDDPILVHYVQRVVRPELVSLGYYDLIDAPDNNLVVRIGQGRSDRVLLIQNYTPTQHHNLMPDPFDATVANARAYGVDEPAVFAQGVSQNKAHQAVMLAVLRLLRTSGVEIRGRLYWAINNEGRSSHRCTEAILDTLDAQPEFAILQNKTGLKIQLGNRGRLDVNVHIGGKLAHSSTPQLGLSAIDGAAEVVTRLKRLTWPDRHPVLGDRQATVYKVRYEPLAPHTLPSDAYVTIDRRLLPGDDLGSATEEIRAALGDLSPYQVTVDPGVYMLPAQVDVQHPYVQALQAANVAARDREAETFYGTGTFDAGGLCARGVPAVMYGASGGDWPIGVDFVPISAVEAEAAVLAHLILSELR